MKVGDIVKIHDVSRSPTDQRLVGVILDLEPHLRRPGVRVPSQAWPDRKVEVMWQNGVIGYIAIMRLERINSESR